MLGEKNRGITLVAMVITIVILLILAGISISNLTNMLYFCNILVIFLFKNKKTRIRVLAP